MGGAEWGFLNENQNSRYMAATSNGGEHSFDFNLANFLESKRRKKKKKRCRHKWEVSTSKTRCCHKTLVQQKQDSGHRDPWGPIRRNAKISMNLTAHCQRNTKATEYFETRFWSLSRLWRASSSYFLRPSYVKNETWADSACARSKIHRSDIAK